jgi:hypothetical protein
MVNNIQIMPHFDEDTTSSDEGSVIDRVYESERTSQIRRMASNM